MNKIKKYAKNLLKFGFGTALACQTAHAQFTAPTLTGDATNLQTAVNSTTQLCNFGVSGIIISTVVIIGVGVAMIIYRRLKPR